MKDIFIGLILGIVVVLVTELILDYFRKTPLYTKEKNNDEIQNTSDVKSWGDILGKTKDI